MKYNLSIIPHVSDSNSAPFIEFKLFSATDTDRENELKNKTMWYFDGMTSEDVKKFGTDMLEEYAAELEEKAKSKSELDERVARVDAVLSGVDSTSVSMKGASVDFSLG